MESFFQENTSGDGRYFKELWDVLWSFPESHLGRVSLWRDRTSFARVDVDSSEVAEECDSRLGDFSWVRTETMYSRGDPTRNDFRKNCLDASLAVNGWNAGIALTAKVLS